MEVIKNPCERFDGIWLLGADGRMHFKRYDEATVALCGMALVGGRADRPRCKSCSEEILVQGGYATRVAEKGSSVERKG